MGGPSRTFTFTRAELAEYHDRAYWAGFDFGEEQARRSLRDEIRQELEDELTGFDPDCDLCRMRRQVAELEKQVARLQDSVTHLQHPARGRAMREGERDYLPPIGGQE